MATIPWVLKGMEYNTCNCDYSCPCQFNSRPTHGDCKFVKFVRIDEGHFGEVKLDGLCFATLTDFPGAIHEGNGTQQLVIDERADDAQRDALRRIAYNEDTDELKTHYAIFNAMSTTVHKPIFARIELELDAQARTARARIPGIARSDAEPIRNPVNGEPHRAQIVLPEGFGLTMLETASGTLTSTGTVPLEFKDSFAAFSDLHMSDRGIIRH